MRKLLMVVAAAMALGACASTTAPVQKPVKAADKAARDLECRSGYVVAYDEQGNPYCAEQ